jgi:hypothetical protein
MIFCLIIETVYELSERNKSGGLATIAMLPIHVGKLLPPIIV